MLDWDFSNSSRPVIQFILSDEGSLFFYYEIEILNYYSECEVMVTTEKTVLKIILLQYFMKWYSAWHLCRKPKRSLNGLRRVSVSRDMLK